MPNEKKQEIILEPFAGANNIPAMLLESDILSNDWACFDIEPPKTNKCKWFQITKQDTIETFPDGYKICITNPPYLSKNSARRMIENIRIRDRWFTEHPKRIVGMDQGER